METLLGLDLGTTTITALAVDAESGLITAKHTRANDAEITLAVDQAKGYSEWNAQRVFALACECLQAIMTHLPQKPVGLGVTGQQHGCLLIDDAGRVASPLINWQDQRGNEAFHGNQRSYVEEVRSRVGEAAFARCGCKLANGYMATTLFWWKEHGELPAHRSACFLPDYIAGHLTGERPATDPTMAGSAGVFNVAKADWDSGARAALGLHREHFPTVKSCGSLLGELQASELPALRGVPVFVPLGDNQASVFGSLAEPENSLLVNIGTGGQVSTVLPDFMFIPNLETRPFPFGYLLASVGLAGGRAYAVLENFFRQVGTAFFNTDGKTSLYEVMNQLASATESDSHGVRCEPFFGGTRAEPARRASLNGLSFDNFTPAHLCRSLLEGTAEAVAQGYELMVPNLQPPRTILIGAGNGIRENPLLASIIEQRLGMTMRVPVHREEAAYGAALVAGVGAGVFATWGDAGRVIRYMN